MALDVVNIRAITCEGSGEKVKLLVFEVTPDNYMYVLFKQHWVEDTVNLGGRGGL